METKELLTAILNGKFDESLDAITETVKTRKSSLAVTGFMQLKVGDVVEFTNIRPQYLNGLRGTLANNFVSGRKHMRASIRIESTPIAGKFSGKVVDIPISCFRKV